ncbi:uncharacterized protein GGS22DRAFT_169996 [Annulohypoxylon maeteangense]|uniref:uncharacterized protein n=1 Tax=Annulohypoxylon maeteangense TaxID=1927788 RepID=UPI0020086F5E|nr:uncharacterized protein GGS22DRAFT_169996 [Annulohypoxylon maeteangense]KAI0882653.1 hypothetical protein GGS22DRAFT_169996 [Annulohypoxylon maeteangense]
MSAEATAAMASAPKTEMVETEVASDPPNNNNNNDALNNKHTGLHSPPDSNSAMKLDGSDDSELSDLDDPDLIDMTVDMDLHISPSIPQNQDQNQDSDNVKQEEEEGEEEEDIGEVIPDHWSGTVPVFRPDMHQFKDFKKFMTKVDCYGMKSGIIKIIPPKEWTDQRPPLDEMIKQIRVKEPIKQDIMGSNGTYRQVNILHQRSYNIPQWRQLCDQSEHQPPARRGERRAQAPSKPKPASSTTTESKRRGRPSKGRGKRGAVKDAATATAAEQEDRPMTPVSPKPNEEIIESVEQDPGADVDDDDGPPIVGRMGGSRQAKPKTQSISARRKYARREASARIDEEAFKDFDYRMDISDYTPERCEELERIYWKTLTYAQPLYGADLPGTLFDDECDVWNLNRLPNLLDVLGTKVPGVNTAYLYLGMWKATFAWHLEDVDLYSINYLHFGAPKQWYSISQGDARRFEAAMKSIWPTDAKACDQFLRHKAFLISPNHLQQYFNIKVNKCVSYPGEFVVTYPYGYHSGYNLGYNCAEAVNFALDSWMPMGKIAKRCECAQAQDSVWVDVYEIERKLRGEETDYEETEDEEEEEDEEDDDTGVVGLTPISSHTVRLKQPGRKRKRLAAGKGEKRAKKIRLRVKNHIDPPCCLCPHDIPGQEILSTSDGRRAHRICALYGPETWIETVEGKEIIANVENISKACVELKCLYCRSKRGACFQCSQKKCARSYHATCAAAAGVMVEEADVPIFGEDGTEYKERGFEFSCRFHRTKRDKKLDGNVLDECQKTRHAAAALKKDDICQLQYYRGEIFAGVIVENRTDERTFLVDIIPHGDRVEVEWKWLLLPDPADFHLQKASANAIPMPTSRKAKEQINATKRVAEELPRADAPFVEGFTWAEFNACDCTNKLQAKIDFAKDNQIWYYLGKNSTEARAQYTDDPKRPKHNPKSNFLETIPRPAVPAVQPRKSYGPSFSVQTPSTTAGKSDKPYQYKPREPVAPSYVHSPFTVQQFVPKPPPFTAHQFIPNPSPFSIQPTAPKLVPAPRPQQNVQYAPQQVVPKQAPAIQHTEQYSSHQIIPKSSSTPQYVNQYSLQQPMHQPAFTDQQNGQISQQTVPKPDSASQQNVQHPSHHSTPKPVSTPQQSAQYTSQQAVSKPTPIPRPTPSQNGHKRNRSSLNSQGSQALAFGSDRRFRTPPFSYRTSQIDSAAKSPFSHGFMQPPGLGPSPSPQNGQLFQAQARARSSSLASNRSYDTPMTSSAIRPPSSASAQGTIGEPQALQQQNVVKQPRPNIVQKYAFFQVHHNRDSTKYRTPYAHWGGFTNGYEGNLRAHLMRSPEALFDIRRRSTGFATSTPSLSPAPRIPFSNGSENKETHNPVLQSGHHDPSRQAAPLPYSASPNPFTTPKTSSPITDDSNQQLIYAPNASDSNQEPIAQLHPAIRAQYAAMLQRSSLEVHLPQSQQTPPEDRPAAPNQQSAPDFSTYSQPPANLTHMPVPSDTQSITDSRIPSHSTLDNKVPSLTNSSSTAMTYAPKQTYIPPPRPWEAIRKTQVTAQPNPQPPNPYSALDAVAPAVPDPPPFLNAPGPFMNDGFGNPRHMADPGLQPSNRQSSQSREFVQTLQPTTIHQLRTATENFSASEIQQESTELAQPATTVNTLAPVLVPSSAAATNDLPEVPDDSMELIESIIRDARRISDTYSGPAGGNV